MEHTIDITPKLFSDSIEFMGTYIDKMRVDEDFETIPAMLVRFNDTTFEPGAISKDQLRQLAVYATDYIYRYATELTARDAYSSVYFKQVIARLMKSLQDAGINVFYILDNELRQDRFELAVMLFELSGMAVMAPYNMTGTLSLDAVENQLEKHMDAGRNIVYIEKDSSVNYMERVIRIATQSAYIGLFRNHAPADRQLQVL